MPRELPYNIIVGILADFKQTTSAHIYMTWEIFAAFSALRAQDSHLRSDITNLGRHPSQQFIGKFVSHGQPLQIRHTRPLYNHYLWLFMKEFFFKEQTQIGKAAGRERV